MCKLTNALQMLLSLFFWGVLKVLPLKRGAGLQQEVTTSWKNVVAV
jgi:hypothetical protein